MYIQYETLTTISHAHNKPIRVHTILDYHAKTEGSALAQS